MEHPDNWRVGDLWTARPAFGKVASDVSNERFQMFAILLCLWVTYLADISSGKILCSSVA